MTAYYKKQSIFSQLNKNSKTKNTADRTVGSYKGGVKSLVKTGQFFYRADICNMCNNIHK